MARDHWYGESPAAALLALTSQREQETGLQLLSCDGCSLQRRLTSIRENGRKEGDRIQYTKSILSPPLLEHQGGGSCKCPYSVSLSTHTNLSTKSAYSHTHIHTQTKACISTNLTKTLLKHKQPRKLSPSPQLSVSVGVEAIACFFRFDTFRVYIQSEQLHQSFKSKF